MSTQIYSAPLTATSALGPTAGFSGDDSGSNMSSSPGERKWCDTPPSQQQQQVPTQQAQHPQHSQLPHHNPGRPSQTSIQFQISQLSLADMQENVDDDGKHAAVGDEDGDGESDSDMDDGLFASDENWGHEHGRRGHSDMKPMRQSPLLQQAWPQAQQGQHNPCHDTEGTAASFDVACNKNDLDDRQYGHEDLEHGPSESETDPSAALAAVEKAGGKLPQQSLISAAPRDTAGTVPPPPRVQTNPHQPASILQVQRQLQMQQDQWQKWGRVHGGAPQQLPQRSGEGTATATATKSQDGPPEGGGLPGVGSESSLLGLQLQQDSSPVTNTTGNQLRKKQEKGDVPEGSGLGGGTVDRSLLGDGQGQPAAAIATASAVYPRGLGGGDSIPHNHIQMRQHGAISSFVGGPMTSQAEGTSEPKLSTIDGGSCGHAPMPPSSSLQSSTRSTASGVFPTSPSLQSMQSSHASAGVPTPTSATAGITHTPPPMYLLPPAAGGPPNAPAIGARGALPIQYYAQQASARPLLYSAIGSLEQGSMHSLGSFGKRYMRGSAAGGTLAAASSAAAAANASSPAYHMKLAQGGHLLPPASSAGHPHLVAPPKGSAPLGPSVSLVTHPQAPSASGIKNSGNKSRSRKQKKSGDKDPAVKRELESQGMESAISKSNQGGKEQRRLSGPVKDRQLEGAAPQDSTVQGKERVALQGPVPIPRKGRKKNGKKKKRVTIDTTKSSTAIISPPRQQQQPVEMFRPSCDAYTPRLGRKMKDIKYKPAEKRTPQVQKMSTTMGTIQRPNFRDALRRVAMILHEHINKIERRFDGGVRGVDDTGLFLPSMRDLFSESNFITPRYKCSLVRLPMARPGAIYGLRRIKDDCSVPTTNEIYDFGHQLFKSVQLSSECSIVCLIYVERLMEVAKVPLMACTWRPIFMSGLLLASKVWQDLSSWNIEFASVYPQFSLEAINRLEAMFLKMVKWDLYISSSLYAKYYFALRSLLEKQDFRQRYNQMVGVMGNVAASDALKVQKRSERVKEEALLQLSRSM